MEQLTYRVESVTAGIQLVGVQGMQVVPSHTIVPVNKRIEINSLSRVFMLILLAGNHTFGKELKPDSRSRQNETNLPSRAGWIAGELSCQYL